MAKTESGTLLGTIVCKYCNRILDMVDTDKVIVIYGCCNDKACENSRKAIEGDTYDR